jgi:hypothetical protein
MACLAGRRCKVNAIEWSGASHRRKGGRFQVPKKIARELGSGDSRPIHLTVRDSAGTVLFEDTIELGSGTEAYPIPGLGLHEPITVVARRL